jgi:putative transposase
VTVFGFIAAKKAEHAVATMCRVLGVSRSGFHAWERREPSRRACQDASLTGLIDRIHAESRKTYGSPRVHAELRLEHGIRVGRKRVERLMRDAGLAGQLKRRRGKTTIRVAGVRTAPDLVERDFDPNDAGLVHHSDQGSQYTSLVFTRRCKAVGIDVSMGSRGDCYDNSPHESFHASLKKDLIHRRAWPTKAEARTAVFEYVEAFYNRRRRHSRLGMLSPVDFENSTLLDDRASLAASRLASIDRKMITTTSQAKAA